VFDLMLLTLLTAISLYGAGHVLLHKRDPRAALGWIVICLVFPGVGAIIYGLFGINRIRNRARRWQRKGRGMSWLEPAHCAWSSEMARQHPFSKENFAAQLSLANAVTRRPLLLGNHLTPLHNGEEAYPAMLEAIAKAERSVYLSSYIFDSDRSGRRFADALIAAAERGVDVRLLIDGIGERYSLRPARRWFRHTSVRVARFLPPSISNRGAYINLRNHRKLLIIDALHGFTGGMNISDRHMVDGNASRRVVDLHFAVAGPVVGQMQDAFLEDWNFVTGEPFLPTRLPEPAPEGSVFCRGISAGPNEDFEKLVWIVVGALNSAQQRVRIMTPYFIPDRALLAAISAAALRGVGVDIILPGKNNLPYVHWASCAHIHDLIAYGCRVYFQPPPFTHSKLLLVDDQYALIGSANLDPRSLRLNFEFNLELYDTELVSHLGRHVDVALAASRRINLKEPFFTSLPQRLRNALAKLFSPYL